VHRLVKELVLAHWCSLSTAHIKMMYRMLLSVVVMETWGAFNQTHGFALF